MSEIDLSKVSSFQREAAMKQIAEEQKKAKKSQKKTTTKEQ